MQSNVTHSEQDNESFLVDRRTMHSPNLPSMVNIRVTVPLTHPWAASRDCWQHKLERMVLSRTNFNFLFTSFISVSLTLHLYKINVLIRLDLHIHQSTQLFLC